MHETCTIPHVWQLHGALAPEAQGRGARAKQAPRAAVQYAVPVRSRCVRGTRSTRALEMMSVGLGHSQLYRNTYTSYVSRHLYYLYIMCSSPKVCSYHGDMNEWMFLGFIEGLRLPE